MLEGLKFETTISVFSEYIPEEEEAYADFRAAGGEISDAARIEMTKAKSGADLEAAYRSYVKMEACRHGPDELLENRWSMFVSVVEKVGRAIGPLAATIPATALTGSTTAPAEPTAV